VLVLPAKYSLKPFRDVQDGGDRSVIVAVTLEVEVEVYVTVCPGAPVTVVVVVLVGTERQLQAEERMDETVYRDMQEGLGLGA
jgi:hypothetical protein